MLCILWDQELLKPGETITAVSYKQKLMKLNQALKKSDQSLSNALSDYHLFRAIQNDLSL